MNWLRGSNPRRDNDDDQRKQDRDAGDHRKQSDDAANKNEHTTTVRATLMNDDDVDNWNINRSNDDIEAPPSSQPFGERASSSSPLLLNRQSDNDNSIRAQDLTLDEKLKLVSGASLWTTAGLERLQIPSLTLSDGPHGLRKPVHEMALGQSHPSTCFPTAALLACSWDTTLIQQVGMALARECIYYNIQVLLGPGLNIKRHGCGGRNFEYFSEDPCLSGQLAKSYIIGVQQSTSGDDSRRKVAACAKHFVVNNQETHRFVVDAILDERTAREIYYKGFQMVLSKTEDEDDNSSIPATIMCAYNQVNGQYCCEHPHILQELLREEFGYNGVTMTDWGATNSRLLGLRHGLDLEMPGSYGVHNDEIIRAIENTDDLPMDCLDESVQRILDLVNKYGTKKQQPATTSSERPLPPDDNDDCNPENPMMWQEHFELAKRVAMESCVLLKNDNNLLPLSSTADQKLAVIGDFAKTNPRYQGMGSSQVTSHKVVTIWDELQQRFVPANHMFYAQGYEPDDEDIENIDEHLLQEALDVVKNNAVDVVILCIGLPEIMESEGFDRMHLQLPMQHNCLVEEICKIHDHVVVVLSSGGVVELPWYEGPSSILETYLAGEAGGAAVVDLLFGVASPCGKLAETFPICQTDILADVYFPGNRDRVEHREGLLVGYRYFDSCHKEVRYPFGHGLSYTTFAYSDLRLDVIESDDNNQDIRVNVSCTVENTGSMAGKEVVQCYIHDVTSSVFRPEQELREFCKIHLEPGQKQAVTFSLTKDAFSFYDIGFKSWEFEHGDYEIRVGSSSRDIRLRGTVLLSRGGVDQASTLAQQSYPTAGLYVATADNHQEVVVDDETFAKRFGPDKDRILSDILQAAQDDQEGSNNEADLFHRNTLLKEVAASRWLGKMLLSIVYRQASKDVKPGATQKRQQRMVKANVNNLPLRVLVLFSGGVFTFDTLDACIALMNLHWIAAMQGFGRALWSFVSRRKRR